MGFIAKAVVQTISTFGLGVAMDRVAKVVENPVPPSATTGLKPPPNKPSGSGNDLLFRFAKRWASEGNTSRCVTIGAGLSSVDRMTTSAETEKPDAKTTPSIRAGTGNHRLRLLAERTSSSADNNVIKQSISAQVMNRKKLFQKGAEVIQHIDRTVQKMDEAVTGLLDDVAIAHGAVNVASGRKPITVDDGIRVMKADMKETWGQVVEDLKNFSIPEAIRSMYRGTVKIIDANYVAATTSNDGIQTVADAIDKRVRSEATSSALGLAISQGTASAVGTIPHLAFKAASVAIKATGSMAAGASLSNALRDVGGGGDESSDSAAKKEITKILSEKSGFR